jgi:hypothetical protein
MKPILAALVVTSPCWALPLLAWASGPFLHWQNRQPFDSERWKVAEPGERYDLSWDLLHRGVLDRKTPAEVESLLGPPMRTETLQPGALPMYYSGNASPGAVVWYYELGYEKYEFQIGPSGTVLAVVFENGVVVRVVKITH